MSERVAKLRQKYFGHIPNDWQAYHREIDRCLAPGMTVLDVGCGPGVVHLFPWEEFPDVRLIGIDPDPGAERNPQVHQFVPMTDPDHWAVEDGVADLIVSRYVLEHIENPETFLNNVLRILKPGGRFVFLTPNFTHPVALISYVLPHGFKVRLLERLVGPERGGYPTFYRLNTRGSINRLAKSCQLDPQMILIREFVPQGYLDKYLIGFLTCWATWSMLHYSRLERWFGGSIVGVLCKAESNKEPNDNPTVDAVSTK